MSLAACGTISENILHFAARVLAIHGKERLMDSHSILDRVLPVYSYDRAVRSFR